MVSKKSTPVPGPQSRGPFYVRKRYNKIEVVSSFDEKVIAVVVSSAGYASGDAHRIAEALNALSAKSESGNRMKTPRSYTEAFEPAEREAISKLIKEFDDLRNSPSGNHVLIAEIQGCLSVGLLLAGSLVSAALLELFVRDLTVRQRLTTKHNGDPRFKAQVEREAEENRNLGFSAMRDEISPAIISASDAQLMRRFYSDTRIPLAHALVRRFADPAPDSDLLDNLFAPLARSFQLEDRLLNGAIGNISSVVRMLKTYRTFLTT